MSLQSGTELYPEEEVCGDNSTELSFIEQTFLDEFEKSIEDLLEHYGNAEISGTGFWSGLGRGCAMQLRFGHKSLCGEVTLSSNAIEASQLGGPAGVELADWIGELCNQIVGRFKNKLLRYEVALILGTPIPVATDSSEKSGYGNQSWRISWRRFNLYCVLDLMVDKSLSLTVTEEPTHLEEGSCLLF